MPCHDLQRLHQPRVIVEHTVADDVEAERDRVYSAFRKMREQIDAMTKDAEFGTAGEHQEILETYKMFAYDEGWSRRINDEHRIVYKVSDNSVLIAQLRYHY